MPPRVQKSVKERTLTLLVNSHVGSWSPGGVLNVQRVIARVKAQWLEEFFISLERYGNVDV